MSEETLWTFLEEIKAVHKQDAGSCITCWQIWPCETLKIIAKIEIFFRDLQKSAWKD